MADLGKIAAFRLPFRKVFQGTRAATTSSAGKVFPEKAPEWFVKGVGASEKYPTKAYSGFKREGTGGTESIAAFLPMMAAEKLFGKGKVREKLWKYVHAPALKADTVAGHTLGKIPGTKRLFTVKEKIPWGAPEKKLYKEVERSSALAPLVKARDIGTPLIVGVGLEKGLKKLTKPDSENQDMDKHLREKVASTMLRLHGENKEHMKHAHAAKLLYKKAELGLERIPASYSEFQEKIAQLMTQDLVVLEKALELTVGTMKLGELDKNQVLTASSPSDAFQAAVLGNDET